MNQTTLGWVELNQLIRCHISVTTAEVDKIDGDQTNCRTLTFKGDPHLRVEVVQSGLVHLMRWCLGEWNTSASTPQGVSGGMHTFIYACISASLHQHVST